MSQCKKVQNSGEQCSNRVVPGTDFCESHSKVTFQLVSEKEKELTTPLLQKKVEQKKESSLKAQNCIARPLLAGEKPQFPGLKLDVGYTLVAAEAIIVLENLSDEQRKSKGGNSLKKLLIHLSQKFDLSKEIQVQQSKNGLIGIIRVKPQVSGAGEIASLFDVVDAITSFFNEKVYIGEGNAFVIYRDQHATRGYDVDGFKQEKDDLLYLIDSSGTQTLLTTDLNNLELSNLLLSLKPRFDHSTSSPRNAYVLALKPYYQILARFFRNHHISFRLAVFHQTQKHDEPMILFEISPRTNSPTGTLIPTFILAYLAKLPHCVVLTKPAHTGNRQMLVECGYKYPCIPSNVIQVFPDNSTIIFTINDDFSNILIESTPNFLEGENLLDVQVQKQVHSIYQPIEPVKDMFLRFEVKLQSSPRQTSKVSAIILDKQELDWLKQLIYRLPKHIFSDYSLCMGKQLSILLSESSAIDRIPFGFTLMRFQASQLFIPNNTRFAPNLSLKVLSETFGLKKNIYTFLGKDSRLDIPRESFSPLSRQLIADSKRPRVDIEILPPYGLPEIVWPEVPQTPDDGESELTVIGEVPKSGLLKKIFGPKTEKPSVPKPTINKEEDRVDLNSVLLERAEEFKEIGDHLSAALCFSMIGDNASAARHYQLAAKEVKKW